MTFKGAWSGAVFSAVILVAAMPAVQAQDANTRALMDRIERLERDIRTLNVQIARGGSGAAASGTSTTSATAAGGADPAYARLSVRMSQVETDLRGVTGRIEELTYQVNQVSQQMEKMLTDVEFRLKQLEQGGAATSMNSPNNMQMSTNTQPAMNSAQPAAPSAAGSPMPSNIPDGSQVLGTLNKSEASVAAPAPQSEADALLAQLTGEAPATQSPAPAPAAAPQAAPAPGAVNTAPSQPSSLPSTQTAALPDGTPRDKYMHAFGLLRQGKYDMASTSLRQFIEEHGDDKLASNARYWLGETYYVRGAFVEAAETFLEGYQTDPQGPKAPDALLKLGMSLASLNKKNEACAAFQKLRGDYPDAPAGLKSTLQREWQKNGCV